MRTLRAAAPRVVDTFRVAAEDVWSTDRWAAVEAAVPAHMATADPSHMIAAATPSILAGDGKQSRALNLVDGAKMRRTPGWLSPSGSFLQRPLTAKAFSIEKEIVRKQLGRAVSS